MKTYLWLLLAALIFSAACCENIFAQPAGGIKQDCSICICVTDNSCSVITDCTDTTGCQFTTFTVPCDGYYTLRSRVTCTNPLQKCHKCQACVNVYKGVEFIANCHNTNCSGLQDCEFACTQVYLNVGATYKLWACLGLCTDEACDSCGVSCTASACVYRDVIACNP